MKYPVTPSHRASASVADLTGNKLSENRGRVRKRLSFEVQLGGNSCSTPVQEGQIYKINQRSLSAGRRFSLGASLIDLGSSTQDISLPVYGKFPSLHPLKSSFRSTTSDVNLDATPISFVTESSIGDESGVSEERVVCASYCSNVTSRPNASSTSKARSKSNQGATIKQKFIDSVRAAAGTLTKRISGSMVDIHNPCEVEAKLSNSLNKKPTYSIRLEQANIEYGDFIAAEDHSDFQDAPRQLPKDNKKEKTRRRSSFSAKSFFGTTHKSVEEFKTPPRGQGTTSMVTNEGIVKKRRASDIHLREIIGGTTKRFSRRKRESFIAENSFDSRNLPDMKKLPLMKKASKSSATGAAVSPSRSLDELLKCRAGILRFRAFLQTEFSDENLDFWIECQTYKHQPPHKQCDLALKIFRKYVAVRAPREVNLDAMTRRKIKDGVDYPDAKTFDLAQTKIFELMERDSFKRFKESLAKSKTESYTSTRLERRL